MVNNFKKNTMNRFNNSQSVGVFILFLGILIYFTSSNPTINTVSGVLSGIGISFVLKFVGLKKKNKNNLKNW